MNASLPAIASSNALLRVNALRDAGLLPSAQANRAAIERLAEIFARHEHALRRIRIIAVPAECGSGKCFVGHGLRKAAEKRGLAFTTFGVSDIVKETIGSHIHPRFQNDLFTQRSMALMEENPFVFAHAVVERLLEETEKLPGIVIGYPEGIRMAAEAFILSHIVGAGMFLLSADQDVRTRRLTARDPVSVEEVLRRMEHDKTEIEVRAVIRAISGASAFDGEYRNDTDNAEDADAIAEDMVSRLLA